MPNLIEKTCTTGEKFPIEMTITGVGAQPSVSVAISDGLVANNMGTLVVAAVDPADPTQGYKATGHINGVLNPGLAFVSYKFATTPPAYFHYLVTVTAAPPPPPPAPPTVTGTAGPNVPE